MGWARRFILFHGKRHPQDMAEAEVAAFLSHLALDRQVSPATQNQALSALCFLYTAVLARPLGEMSGIVRAKRPRRLPTVLTQNEIGQILSRLKGTHWLIACILYGSGLRLMESVRLRVKDIDFAHQALFARNAKGGKDRIVTLPGELNVPLRRHLAGRRTTFERDILDGAATVYLPYGSSENIPARQVPGAGSTSFLLPVLAGIPVPGPFGVTTSTRVACNGRFVVRCVKRVSRSRPLATLCGIHSPHICSKGEWTSAPCRSNSGTPTSEPHRSIRTCSCEVEWR